MCSYRWAANQMACMTEHYRMHCKHSRHVSCERVGYKKNFIFNATPNLLNMYTEVDLGWNVEICVCKVECSWRVYCATDKSMTICSNGVDSSFTFHWTYHLMNRYPQVTWGLPSSPLSSSDTAKKHPHAHGCHPFSFASLLAMCGLQFTNRDRTFAYYSLIKRHWIARGHVACDRGLSISGSVCSNAIW